MSILIDEKKNIVKFGEHTAKYFRIFSGKKYEFQTIVGSHLNLKQAKEIAVHEKELIGHDYRIIRVGNRYLVYIHIN